MTENVGSVSVGGVNVVVMMVTYNSQALIRPLLSVIEDWLGTNPVGRFVLVENSGDPAIVDLTIRSLHQYADRVEARVADGNMGFAPGMNLAFDIAKEKWEQPAAVVLLNPDIVTDADTISVLSATLLSEDLGVACPILRDAESGSLDGGVARRQWNRRRLFLAAAGIPQAARFLGTSKRTFDEEEVFGLDRLVNVDLTSGAFMAIRTDVYGDGLDTRLPMYLEDQEICERARVMGRRVCVVTDITATHIGGASRKTHSAAQYSLRTMELAEAPAQSFVDCKNGTLLEARLAIGLGGLARCVLVSVVSVGALVSKSKRAWVVEQWRLGVWFIEWAGGRRPDLTLGGAVGKASE